MANLPTDSRVRAQGAASDSCHDVRVRQLLPYTPESTAEVDLLALAEKMLIAIKPARPWHLRSNMIATIDGAISGASGTSADISNIVDLQMLAMLRGISDAVVVGSRNALIQPYRPLPARPRWQHMRAAYGLAPAPRLVVVTNSGLPQDAACFTDALEPTIVLTSSACAPQKLAQMREVAHVIVTGAQTVDLSAAMHALSEMGLWRVLCEGGPSLLSAFSAQDLVDEACVTTAAIWSGAATTAMTRDVGLPTTTAPAQMFLSHLLIDEDDYLYARWVREQR